MEFGTSNGVDSLLITRHGRIVAEAYYAPFTSGLKHRVNSTTKSVVGTLVAMALQDGLLKSVDQRCSASSPIGSSPTSMSARKRSSSGICSA